MNWYAYPASSPLSTNVKVEVRREFLPGEAAPTHPVVGDNLFIEFPDNSRAGGIIESASTTFLSVNVNHESFIWDLQGESRLNSNHFLILIYIVKENGQAAL